MPIPFIIFTYIVVWTISLFVLLPVKGWSLRRKAAVNTLVAAVITLFIYLLLQSGLVPLRNVY